MINRQINCYSQQARDHQRHTAAELGVISGNQNFKGKKAAAAKLQAVKAALSSHPYGCSMQREEMPVVAATSPHGPSSAGTALC